MKHKTYLTETKAVDAEAGIFDTWISTEAIDRDKDIVRASGADLESYMRNPVVLFGHNYADANAVVGKALEVEIIPGKGIRSRFQFADRETSEAADRVRRLWAGGFLNATSIGFIPKRYERRKDEEGNKAEGMDIQEWEMLEFSIVPVPANQEALRLAAKMVAADAESMNTDLAHFSSTADSSGWSDRITTTAAWGGTSDTKDNTDPAYLPFEGEPETKDEDNTGLGAEPETVINDDTEAEMEAPNNTTPSHDESEEIPDEVIDQLRQTIEDLMEVLQ